MKKFNIALILLFFVLKTFSQEYLRLVEENKTWNVLSVTLTTELDTSYSTITYMLSGDTTLNSIVYQKLYSSKEVEPTNWSLEYAIREGLDKKVWLLDFKSENEYLLYDFSVDPEDTVLVGNVESIYLHVDSVTEIAINQRQRKKFWMTGINLPDYKETWIEGIGSDRGICWSGSAMLAGGWYRLLCVHKDNDLIYMNPHYQSCFLFTNNSVFDDTYIKLIPNPANSFMRIINGEYIEIESTQIYNLSGKLVRQYNPKESLLDITNISSGVYLVKIKYKGGEKVQRIIIP